MFLQHKTWAACRGRGCRAHLWPLAGPDSNSRADGSPARGARTGSSHTRVRGGRALPACSQAWLSFPRLPFTVTLDTPAVTPSRPSFFRSPWSPLHPCWVTEYSFLSVPCRGSSLPPPHAAGLHSHSGQDSRKEQVQAGPGCGRWSTGLPFWVLLCRGPRCPCPISSRPLKPMTAAAETHRGRQQQTPPSGLCMGHSLCPRQPRR